MKKRGQYESATKKWIFFSLPNALMAEGIYYHLCKYEFVDLIHYFSLEQIAYMNFQFCLLRTFNKLL